jgi:hypothetical protein
MVYNQVEKEDVPLNDGSFSNALLMISLANSADNWRSFKSE